MRFQRYFGLQVICRELLVRNERAGAFDRRVNQSWRKEVVISPPPVMRRSGPHSATSTALQWIQQSRSPWLQCGTDSYPRLTASYLSRRTSMMAGGAIAQTSGEIGQTPGS
jgi:hypothetical protein